MFGGLGVNSSWERRRRGLRIAHHSSATGWLRLGGREQDVNRMHGEPRRRWSRRRERERERRDTVKESDDMFVKVTKS